MIRPEPPTAPRNVALRLPGPTECIGTISERTDPDDGVPRGDRIPTLGLPVQLVSADRERVLRS
jgi:hypothetical protein